MKISSERSLINLEAYIKSAQESEGLKSSRRQEQREVTQTESVNLSHKAKDLQKAREVMEATPEIRENKVGQLKREIEAGTYSVKRDEIATKMVRESLIDAFI
jgi:negative regulator of flagellin synthesis FlgM